MNINPTSNISCEANPFAKAKTRAFKTPLKDGSEVVIKVKDNAYECLTTNSDRMKAGVSGLNPKCIGDGFVSIVKNIKENAKEGFDFLREFIKAVTK